MKILLLSDTHSDLTKAIQIYEKLTDIDLIIHCGDYLSDGYALEDRLGVPVVAVKGNCDHGDTDDCRIVETPAGNLLVTHGHYQMVDFRFDNLLYAAAERDCIAACFGHTHKAFCENFDGIWLINPGSLSEPRDGTNGTYAILHAEEDGFYANIVDYDRICGPDHRTGTSGQGQSPKSAAKSKVKGGFLRGLLNYSDRF